MVKISIDDITFEVEDGTTVFKAAKLAGIPIPHFCYHTAFAPKGSCRLCLVEIEGLPKLELACSTVVRDGMKISTKSDRVVEARKGVLEFFLAEHPLDCPICDKAGDCKLQDYYEEYGLFESRYRESKERRRKKAPIGRNLIHDQERCVLCRRCVRFLEEITKTGELGVFERSIHTEINVFDQAQVDNSYSGNLAQICPVGAITDSDFRFSTRSWFLQSKDSICPLCSRGCNTTVQAHKGFARFELPKRVYRIKARNNPSVNGHWICDRGRYTYSYMDQNRLDSIVVRNNGEIQAPKTWDEAVPWIAEKIKTLHFVDKTKRIAVFFQSWLTNEEIYLIHRIFKTDLGVNKIFLIDPPEGEKDDLLLMAGRTPNLKGAEAIGLVDMKPDFETLASDVDVLLVFGTFALGLPRQEGLRNLMERVETTVLLSPHGGGELFDAADLVLPTALIAEKGGSLTSAEGLVQNFAPALEAPGTARPEWRILIDLAKAINVKFEDYSRLASPGDVYKCLAEEISFFEK